MTDSVLRRRVDAAWGRQLRQMRQERGLSRFGLACKTGVSIYELCQHEHGLRRMTPAQIVRYAEVLGVRLSAFARPFSRAQPEAAQGSPVLIHGLPMQG